MTNKVYIIQNKETLIIYGCFKDEERAVRYIDDSRRYQILETEVA